MQGWEKGRELYKMCPDQGSYCNHIVKCTFLLSKLHQENAISTVGPASHYIGQGNIHLQVGQTSTPPNQTTLGAPLCSKGSFSH